MANFFKLYVNLLKFNGLALYADCGATSEQTTWFFRLLEVHEYYNSGGLIGQHSSLDYSKCTDIITVVGCWVNKVP